MSSSSPKSGRKSPPPSPPDDSTSDTDSPGHSQGKNRFDIHPKRPDQDLESWRKSSLFLNPARRLRYSADLRLRDGSHAVIAARRFQAAGEARRARKLLQGSDDKGDGKCLHLVRNKDHEELGRLGGVQSVANRLQTSVDKGIPDDPSEVQNRKTKYGDNTYPKKASKGFWVFVWEAFHDKTLIILMICAALSLAFGMKTEGAKEGWYDGASIGFAVILVVFVTAISDYKQSLQFASLNAEKDNIQLEVVRGGRRFEISIFEIVVGDLVPLNIGDQIPADGLLVLGHSLSVDESSMTGESKLVHVGQNHPFLVSGCKIVDGFGSMVVTAVGMNTEWGELMAAVSDDTVQETPLQVRLSGVATFIGRIGVAVATLVFVILIVFYFTGHSSGSETAKKFKAGQTSAGDIADRVVAIFAIAVTIIVVAVPEGLPLAVTLTLAYSMRKMMADKALVRRLAACETMGSATTICSDKTGTLTLNQMNVVKAWVAGDMREHLSEMRMLDSNIYNIVLEGIGQNSSGSVFVPERGAEPEVSGSPTEKAVLVWGLQLGMDFESVRSKSTIMQVEVFNSTKKRAGVAVKVVGSGEMRIHWKGAAEIVLNDCDKWVNAEGRAVPMTEEKRKELENILEGMAAASLRCVAFAYRDLQVQEAPEESKWEEWSIPESSMTLLAIAGIKDPCRPGVLDAVRLCQAAGVKIRMVTGDNIITAKAIATECGILREGDLAIEGATFRKYSPKERRSNLPKISVMARSSPTDKLLMVQTLQKMGEVVAVTGDGTNDAPALHQADIGLSMGIQGTEVAKESSDIIILDDNFASVVKVVRWGRSVYFNVQKFIQFQLTVNVAALVINFVSAVSSGEVPLTAVQLLWVNLIMDTLGALALATEPPTDDLMLRPPVGRTEPIITNIMWRNVIGQAVYQVVVLLTLQFRGIKLLKLKGTDALAIKNTVIFNSFVLCQLFNEINSRKPQQFNIFKGILHSPVFLGVVTTTLILQALIVEFLGKFAATKPLHWQYWVVCIVIGFMSWPIAVVLKCIPVPAKPCMDTSSFNCCGRKSAVGISRGSLSHTSEKGFQSSNKSLSHVSHNNRKSLPNGGPQREGQLSPPKVATAV